MGFLELRRQGGVSHEVPRGSQGASCVAPGKSSIPFELQVRTGDCSPVTAGQNRPHLSCVQDLVFHYWADRDLRVAFSTHLESQASS